MGQRGILQGPRRLRFPLCDVRRMGLSARRRTPDHGTHQAPGGRRQTVGAHGRSRSRSSPRRPRRVVTARAPPSSTTAPRCITVRLAACSTPTHRASSICISVWSIVTRASPNCSTKPACGVSKFHSRTARRSPASCRQCLAPPRRPACWSSPAWTRSRNTCRAPITITSAAAAWRRSPSTVPAGREQHPRDLGHARQLRTRRQGRNRLHRNDPRTRCRQSRRLRLEHGQLLGSPRRRLRPAGQGTGRRHGRFFTEGHDLQALQAGLSR